MPVRNVWSLHPGECIIAEQIVKKTGWKCFSHPHDRGVDLPLVKGQKHVEIQVKESRYYHGHK